jgi:hypothetical protein
VSFVFKLPSILRHIRPVSFHVLLLILMLFPLFLSFFQPFPHPYTKAVYTTHTVFSIPEVATKGLKCDNALNAVVFHYKNFGAFDLLFESATDSNINFECKNCPPEIA